MGRVQLQKVQDKAGELDLFQAGLKLGCSAEIPLVVLWLTSEGSPALLDLLVAFHKISRDPLLAGFKARDGGRSLVMVLFRPRWPVPAGGARGGLALGPCHVGCSGLGTATPPGKRWVRPSDGTG